MKIVVLDADKEARKFFQDKRIEGSEIQIFDEGIKEVPMAKINDADILCIFVHTTKFDEEILKHFSNLKMITTRSTGFDHIDLNYCKSRNIKVANVPAYGAVTVAEFTFALLLASVRSVRLASSDMKKGQVDASKYMGFDLLGRTLGVIGTGSIGRHVIKIAQGFGMNVIAFDPFPKELEGVRNVSLSDLYKEADIITLHCPSTPENYHLIDAGAIEAMKQGVYIVNTARGDLIDAESLYFGLKSGKVAGAGLDVLEYEDFLIHDDITPNAKDEEYALKSMFNSKLMLMDKVVLTPHIAFNSKDAVLRILQTSLENMEGFVKGEPKNLVE